MKFKSVEVEIQTVVAMMCVDTLDKRRNFGGGRVIKIFYILTEIFNLLKFIELYNRIYIFCM